MTAREAVQTAEDARLITLKNQADARLAQERAASAGREATANALGRTRERMRMMPSVRAQQHRPRPIAQGWPRFCRPTRRGRSQGLPNAQLMPNARSWMLTNSRARNGVQQAAKRRQSTGDARAMHDAVRALKLASDRARSRVAGARARRSKALAERTKLDAELAAQRAARDKEAVEAANQQARKSAAEQSEREKQELRNKLVVQLNSILQTKDSARGLIVNMSDVLFDTGTVFAQARRAREAGQDLRHRSGLSQPEARGGRPYRQRGIRQLNMRLSENRANSVRDFLVRQGIVGIFHWLPWIRREPAGGNQRYGSRPAAESPRGVGRFRRSHRRLRRVDRPGEAVA